MYRTQKYEKKQQSFFDSSFQGNDGGVSSKKSKKKFIYGRGRDVCAEKGNCSEAFLGFPFLSEWASEICVFRILPLAFNNLGMRVLVGVSGTEEEIKIMLPPIAFLLLLIALGFPHLQVSFFFFQKNNHVFCKKGLFPKPPFSNVSETGNVLPYSQKRESRKIAPTEMN